MGDVMIIRLFCRNPDRGKLIFLDPFSPDGYGQYENIFPLPLKREKMTATHPNRPSNLRGLYFRNYAANVTGEFIVILLNVVTPLAVFQDWRNYIRGGGWILIPISLIVVFFTATLMQYLIQRPIAAVLQKMDREEVANRPEADQARRRLLNLPFIIAVKNVILWIFFTAVILPVMSFRIDLDFPGFLLGFFRFTMIGLIASYISFFLVDQYCRKYLVPLFFQEGQLTAQPGTLKISILRRIQILFGAGTIVPMLLLVGTLSFAVWEVEDFAVAAGQFGRELLVFTIVLCLIFICVSRMLNYMVGNSILVPIREMVKVVDKIRSGDFHRKVAVVSNDELGDLGDGMNEMTDGLVERDQMRQSLYLAKEVQQALLPRTVPQIPGLDIASTSVYCDETGGDYYDFFVPANPDAARISIVVGDVSGHGISSALLMTTARAFFRQRSAMPGRISAVVSDVNRLLAHDVADSGGFMTLFCLKIDRLNRKISWVRAGHDPALFYDPRSEAVEELRGSGLAMGIDGDHEYEQYVKEDLAAGQIILMGTDGIWEAQNSKGEMFGKEPLYRIIQQYSDADARGLMTASLYALDKFRDGVKPEDDVTLVVVKVTDAWFQETVKP
jgi:sigma-B regulation protein RsbU (phosphoserine phosphatase)